LQNQIIKMAKESSDEKLLNLIEGMADAKKMPKGNFKNFKGKVDFLQTVNKLKIKFDLVNVNRGLISLGFMLTVLFFYIFLSDSGIKNYDLLFPQPESSRVSLDNKTAEEKTLKLQYYQDVTSKRNMFLASGVVLDSDTGEKQIAAKLEDMVKSLKVVGIVWSNNPEAMVEDEVDKRTVLIKKGDLVGSKQLRVKLITKNTVVLECEFENQLREVELK
jgi:hypothetical protein